jgi:hypothetical protein
LAEQFVEEGLYGEIPKALQYYIDYEAIARDLGMDYSEIRIVGTNYIYRCDYPSRLQNQSRPNRRLCAIATSWQVKIPKAPHGATDTKNPFRYNRVIIRVDNPA